MEPLSSPGSSDAPSTEGDAQPPTAQRPWGTGAFASLGIRNFRMFIAGQLVSTTGQWMQIVVVSLLVLDRTGSGAVVGVVTLLQYLPLLLLAPWAGAVIERANTRALLIATQVAQCALAFGLWAVAAFGALTVPWILVYSALFGIVQPFDNPARRTFIFEMVGGPRVANAVALNSAVMTTSRLLGPAAAGLLVSVGAATVCFLVNAASYLLIIGALALMRRSEMCAPHTASGPANRGAISGLRYAARTPRVRWPLMMTAVTSMLLQNYPVMIPLLAAAIQAGPETVGLLFGGLSIGSLIMALGVARSARTGFGIVSLAAIGYGTVAIGTAFSPAGVVLIMSMVVLGGVDQWFSSTANATLQVTTRPEFRARVMALFSAFFIGMQGMSGMYVGALSDLIGPRAAIAIAGSATTLVGLLALLTAVRLRRAERTAGTDH